MRGSKPRSGIPRCQAENSLGRIFGTCVRNSGEPSMTPERQEQEDNIKYYITIDILIY
jgi:hypothetical protein